VSNYRLTQCLSETLVADGTGDTSDYKTGQRSYMTLTDFGHLKIMCPDLIAGTAWFRLRSSGWIL